LSAPGIDARWNSLRQKVIYTAGSVSLACLENLAHKSGTALSSGNFSMSTIEIEDSIELGEISISELKSLNKEWFKVENYPLTQRLGDSWISKVQSAVLKVPSAIIELEFNYLLNPLHPEFSRIKIVDITKYTFDPRLRGNSL
jgi:RES domain-containing protein